MIISSQIRILVYEIFSNLSTWDIIFSMNVKMQIKMLAASRGTTLKKLAEKLGEITGEECTYNSLLGKLNRESLSLKEAKIIADILNYRLEFTDIYKKTE